MSRWRISGRGVIEGEMEGEMEGENGVDTGVLSFLALFFRGDKRGGTG
jgi:hypothetical protein